MQCVPLQLFVLILVEKNLNVFLLFSFYIYSCCSIVVYFAGRVHCKFYVDWILCLLLTLFGQFDNVYVLF